ncbi:EamA/RhaT family transporter [Roseateles sp. P5_E11]
MQFPHALPSWSWIPIVVLAALAQSVRNAAQRSLTSQVGTLGATLVRFLYGLPFAALWVFILQASPATTAPVAHFGVPYFAWLVGGAVCQIAATAFLLAAMKDRQFVIGVAFSKTEVLQVAMFSTLFLHELPSALALAAMVVATAGIALLALQQRPAAKDDDGADHSRLRPAIFGLASGACFALSAVGFRGAALQVPELSPWLAGAWGVMWAQAVQSGLMLSWFLWRSPATVRGALSSWRVSSAAGLAGAVASIAWFTAFAMQSVSEVRTLGLVEVFFSYLVSRRIFQEQTLTKRELYGLGLVMIGLAGVCLSI